MSYPSSLLSFALLLASSSPGWTSCVLAISTAPSSLPQIDFSRMGSVGIVGSFAGLDFYTDSASGVNASGSTTTTTTTAGFSSEADTFVLREQDGSGIPISTTDTGGVILSLCWSSNDPFSPSSTAASSSNGTIYLGGEFSSIGGVDAVNLAAYDLGSGTFYPLGGTRMGVDGKVEVVYCDDTNERVWIGGSFGGPTTGSTGGSSSTYGGNVLIFSEASGGGFEPVPFGGLNGEVRTIEPSDDGKSIYLGGAFTTSYASNSTTLTTTNGTSTGGANGTSDVVGSLGSAPNGTVTTGFSGYLTPISMTASSINLTAGPSTTLAGYMDPSILLCPAAGEAYLGRDSSVVLINVLTYKQVQASGVRIGNGLINGDGTTAFRLVTIPDNTVQTLTYLDPVTGVNSTCSSTCPLSTNATVEAQDFLFPSPMAITGYQVTLLEWEGSAAGLSRLQLLSTGSAASSVATDNPETCASDSTTVATDVQTVGAWETCTSTTEIAGTTQRVLYIDVPVGSTSRPSVTYSPYIASSGFYEISVVIPGCTDMGDCDSRSSVDVVVQPYQGATSLTTTVSEYVTTDTYASVYSGYVQATADGFQMTITLALAETPAKPKNSNLYEVVAGSVVLTFYSAAVQSSNGTWVEAGVAGSANVSSSGVTTSTTMSTNQDSFGVFEWVLTGTSANAVGSLSNSTETEVDRLGFALSSALNATYGTDTASADWDVSAFATLNDIVYIGGKFSQSGNYSNVLSITSAGVVTPLAAQGLNGAVSALAALGNYVYAGGNFTSTAASGGVSLAYLARYDPSASTWAAMAGGVDGPVRDVSLASDGSSLLVTGNFSNILGSAGNASASGGFAIYSTSSGSWSGSSSGLVIGNVTDVVVTGKAAGQSSFLAGRMVGMSANSAQGIAMLSGSGADVAISSVPVGLSESTPATTSSYVAKRGYSAGHGNRIHSTKKSRSWLNLWSNVISKRATVTAPALPEIDASAPAIFAGVFWTNSSASGSPSITIFGGNFTNPSPAISGVGLYNSKSGDLTGTTGAQVDGVVRALAVDGNDLYVGGQLTLGTNNGIAVYNLASNTWGSDMPALTGSTVNVSAIAQRSGTTTLIVAGHFDTAGTTACSTVCSWDTSSSTWTALGSGLQGGEVRSLAFVGSSAGTLVIAGSFLMSDGSVGYVATYSFDNATWMSLGSTGEDVGQLPGPVSAMTADNSNATSIFASGLSAADQTPFLSWWNGESWTAQNSTMESGSLVQQLVVVPLAQDHATTGSLETDRMLMVSGSLLLDSSGDVSTALFDGQFWYPYLTSLTSTGAAGLASALFYSQASFSFAATHHLAVGLVVLIAIAISTGLVFLLVLLGLLLTICRHRSTNRNKGTAVFAKDAASVISDTSSDHARRLATIQRAVFGGAGGAALGTSLARRNEKSSPVSSPRSSFGDGSYDSHLSNGVGGEAVGAAAAVAASGETHDSSAMYSEAPSDLGRPTRMKFDFAGQEAAELTVVSGEEIHVIEEDENEDGRGWVLARTGDGRQGVVPASYVW